MKTDHHSNHGFADQPRCGEISSDVPAEDGVPIKCRHLSLPRAKCGLAGLQLPTPKGVPSWGDGAGHWRHDSTILEGGVCLGPAVGTPYHQAMLATIHTLLNLTVSLAERDL